MYTTKSTGKVTGQAAGLPRDMTVICVIPVTAHGSKSYFRGIYNGGMGNAAVRFGSKHPGGRRRGQPPIEWWGNSNLSD